MEYISPFDFRKIFVDIFLGSQELVAFALVLLISFASAKFGMSNRNFMLILSISSVILAGILGEAVYILVLVVIGFIIFKTMSRIFI